MEVLSMTLWELRKCYDILQTLHNRRVVHLRTIGRISMSLEITLRIWHVVSELRLHRHSSLTMTLRILRWGHIVIRRGRVVGWPLAM